MPPLCVAVEWRVFRMARLIDADALLAEYDRQHEGEPGKARKLIEDAPTIDRPTRSQFKRMAVQLGYEPVVRCKECVYWTPRHVKMNDGTIRFYERNEGIVTIEKGINVGSYCKRFDDVTVHGYRDGEPCIDKTKAWCNQDDFCSYGERRENR